MMSCLSLLRNDVTNIHLVRCSYPNRGQYYREGRGPLYAGRLPVAALSSQPRMSCGSRRSYIAGCGIRLALQGQLDSSCHEDSEVWYRHPSSNCLQLSPFTSSHDDAGNREIFRAASLSQWHPIHLFGMSSCNVLKICVWYEERPQGLESTHSYFR